MNSGRWLQAADRELTTAGIATARLDALILLEDVSGRDRGWLLAHPEHELPPAQTARLKKLLNRRARHEPLAYIRGKAEFYGREFVLTPAVLQPRPESEAMIDLLKALPFKGRKIRLADVGTGSGALGITAALELPNCQVDLLEIDPKAIKIAKMNVDKFTLNINLIKGDLLAQTPRPYDVLLCNLPYVPDDFQINESAGHEPRLAIFGGSDGLNLYRKLFQQIAHRPQKPLYILTESLPPQHAQLAEVARAGGYQLAQTEDFIQLYQFRGSVGS